MTCRACEEARQKMLAIYDRLAASIRRGQPAVKLQGPSNTREPYTQEEIDEIRRKL